MTGVTHGPQDGSLLSLLGRKYPAAARAGWGLGLGPAWACRVGLHPEYGAAGPVPASPIPGAALEGRAAGEGTRLSDSRPAGSSSLGTLRKGGPGWDKAFRGHILTALGDKLPLHTKLFPMSGDRAG